MAADVATFCQRIVKISVTTEAQLGVDIEEDLRKKIYDEPSYESLTLSGKIKGLAREMQKNLWAVLNKISSDSLASKLEEELKKKEIETIGVIPYDLAVFTACLEGNPISQGQSTRQAGKILDLLLSKTTK